MNTPETPRTGATDDGISALGNPAAVEAMAAAVQQRQRQMAQAQARFTASHASTSAGGSGSGDGSSGGGKPSGGGTKRKRVVLSIYEKQQVLQRLKNGEQPVVIARAFGISRQQVSDIKKNKDRILSFCVDAKHLSTLRRKTLRATSEYHPGVEQELYRWMIRQRRLGRAVTSDALTAKATDLFTQYSAEDSSHVSPKAISNWMRHFKRAHGLKTFSDDEFERLPDRFVPAMDMTRAIASADASVKQQQSAAVSASALAPTEDASITTSAADANTTANSSNNYFLGTSGVPSASMLPTVSSTSTSTVGMPVTVEDVSSYISAMTSASANALPQQMQGGNSALHAAINTAHQLNAQLAYFEREMGLKLDYLDARVEKLCFLVLPPRFT